MAVDPTAALVLAAQRNKYNPAEDSRRQLALILQQNAQSFAQNPVKSPMEGIARALMTGVQGLTSGVERGYAEAKQRETSQGLIDYANAAPGSPEQAAARDKLQYADPEIVAGLAAQQIGLNTAVRQAGLAGNAIAGGGAAPTTAGAPSGLGNPITPESLGIVPAAPTAAPTTGAPMSTTASGSQPQTGAYDPAKAVSFLTNDPDLKLAPHQAAGLVANLQRESGMVPTAVNPKDGRDGSNSIGMGQWNAERAQALQTFATTNKLDPNDPQTQLAFIKSELLGPERASLDALRNAPDAASAAAAGVGYFRPKDTAAAIADAQRRVLTMPGGIQVGQPPVITPAQPPGAVPPGVPAPGGTPPGGTPPGGTPPGGMPAQTPSGTKIDTSIPPPPFMQPGATGAALPPAGAAPPVVTANNVPAAGPPAAPAPSTPAPSSVPSAPPKYELPAERRQYWGNLATQRVVTPEVALEMIQRETAAGQAIATDAWKNDVAQKNLAEQNRVKMEQGTQETFIKNRLDNYDKNVRPPAMDAVKDMNLIYRARQLLEGGAATGPGTDTRLKIADALGLARDQSANTQVLQATLAQRLINNLGGHLGAGISKDDQKFIADMQGNTNWTKEGLQRLLTIAEQENKNRIDLHDQEAGRLKQLFGMNNPGVAAQFALPQVPSYEEFKKNNPLPTEPAPGAGTAPAASGAVPGSSRETPIPVTDPVAARKLGSGTWIALPDGNIGRVP